MIKKYSEQLVFQPLKEIQYWFTYSSGTFLNDPGYPPLYYYTTSKKKVSPNKSAVCSIGEGIAGYLSQQLYKCRKLARPNHDFPDIVMTSHGKTYLVESKATLSSDSGIMIEVRETLPRMASFVSSCVGLDRRPIIGLLIGTYIINETNYHCYITELIPK